MNFWFTASLWAGYAFAVLMRACMAAGVCRGQGPSLCSVPRGQGCDESGRAHHSRWRGAEQRAHRQGAVARGVHSHVRLHVCGHDRSSRWVDVASLFLVTDDKQYLMMSNECLLFFGNLISASCWTIGKQSMTDGVLDLARTQARTLACSSSLVARWIMHRP